MALWFVGYATFPITVTIYDISNVIVYDVTLLLSMTYHFQSRLGKTDCTDIRVIKLKHQVSPSIICFIIIYRAFKKNADDIFSGEISIDIYLLFFISPINNRICN